MTDYHMLPDDHVLKPLEKRLLEMADEAGPLKAYANNATAALRVFAAEHPGLRDEAVRIGTVYQDEETGEYVMPADFDGDDVAEWR